MEVEMEMAVVMMVVVVVVAMCVLAALSPFSSRPLPSSS
jgi:hypothetical protein